MWHKFSEIILTILIAACFKRFCSETEASASENYQFVKIPMHFQRKKFPICWAQTFGSSKGPFLIFKEICFVNLLFDNKINCLQNKIWLNVSFVYKFIVLRFFFGGLEKDVTWILLVEYSLTLNSLLTSENYFCDLLLFWSQLL